VLFLVILHSFLPNDSIWHCESFSFSMSLLEMSFGERFYINRKGGTGGGGYLQGANSVAVSGLGYRKTLVGTWWPISVLFGVNGLRYKPYSLHFQCLGPVFQLH